MSRYDDCCSQFDAMYAEKSHTLSTRITLDVISYKNLLQNKSIVYLVFEDESKMLSDEMHLYILIIVY